MKKIRKSVFPTVDAVASISQVPHSILIATASSVQQDNQDYQPHYAADGVAHRQSRTFWISGIDNYSWLQVNICSFQVKFRLFGIFCENSFQVDLGGTYRVVLVQIVTKDAEKFMDVEVRRKKTLKR